MSPGVKILRALLLLFAFGVPVSIAVAETAGYLVLPVMAWLYWREGRRLAEPVPMRGWMVLFVAIALLASCFGTRPLHSLDKMHRLLLLGVFPAVLLAWPRREGEEEAGALKLVGAYLAGSAGQAAWDLVALPLRHLRALERYAGLAQVGPLPGGSPLHPQFYDVGNMRDPQMYLTGLFLAAGLLLYLRLHPWRRWWWGALAVQSAAFVLHFKRGAWAAFLVAMFLVAFRRGRRRLLVIGALALLAAVALPQVRDRISRLDEEFRVKSGGRAALWTRVAPKLLAKHPWGMGFDAPRPEDFKGHKVKIQPRLDHLHNNALQVALELGWTGLAVWLGWMISAFALMIRLQDQAARAGPVWSATAFGVLAAFAALHLNGLVEYNFGDTEVFMLKVLLMALAAWMSRRLAHPASIEPWP